MKKHTYYSRIIALVMSLLFIVLLGGCGGSKEANNIKKPPKEAKIELDMEVFGLSSITINDVPETLEIKKLAITKRLTESVSNRTNHPPVLTSTHNRPNKIHGHYKNHGNRKHTLCPQTHKALHQECTPRKANTDYTLAFS